MNRHPGETRLLQIEDTGASDLIDQRHFSPSTISSSERTRM
jgi:hypothetical protein